MSLASSDRCVLEQNVHLKLQLTVGLIMRLILNTPLEGASHCFLNTCAATKAIVEGCSFQASVLSKLGYCFNEPFVFKLNVVSLVVQLF